MSKKPELTDIAGLGPKTQEALAEAGIKTVNKLSKADPAKLAAKVDGLSEAQATKFIAAAQKLAAPPKTKKKPEKKDSKKKVEKKPKKEAPKEEKPKKKPSLTDISGLGPKTRKSLAEAGTLTFGFRTDTLFLTLASKSPFLKPSILPLNGWIPTNS